MVGKLDEGRESRAAMIFGDFPDAMQVGICISSPQDKISKLRIFDSWHYGKQFLRFDGNDGKSWGIIEFPKNVVLVAGEVDGG